MDDIAAYATRLGDDALVLSQRLCEWSSNAPVLEEDLALSNVALDYLGRVRMLYGLAGERTGRSEDELAFLRDVMEFENLLMVELPRGDFAFTMVRQYLLDEFESVFFTALLTSRDEVLAGIAGKTVKEVQYHKRRSVEWMRRLGLGTQESNRRAQQALEELWGYVDEFFVMDALEHRLVEQGIAVARDTLEQPWRAAVAALLAETDLRQPAGDWQVLGGRDRMHTEHLGHLLSEMQFMQRAYPGLNW
jgi:ring-1,2-phenylacetyl-CoA epoxidase subunit PaaC